MYEEATSQLPPAPPQSALHNPKGDEDYTMHNIRTTHMACGHREEDQRV